MPKSWAVCLFLAIASSRASPWRGRCALIAISSQKKRIRHFRATKKSTYYQKWSK